MPASVKRETNAATTTFSTAAATTSSTAAADSTSTVADSTTPTTAAGSTGHLVAELDVYDTAPVSPPRSNLTFYRPSPEAAGGHTDVSVLRRRSIDEVLTAVRTNSAGVLSGMTRLLPANINPAPPSSSSSGGLAAMMNSSLPRSNARGAQRGSVNARRVGSREVEEQQHEVVVVEEEDEEERGGTGQLISSLGLITQEETRSAGQICYYFIFHQIPSKESDLLKGVPTDPT